MSVRPSAKPIVRRQTATTPPSKVLLTIPDFRGAKSAVTPTAPISATEELASATMGAAKSGIEATPKAEGDDVLESLEMAVAYEQATGSHPLGTQEVEPTDSPAMAELESQKQTNAIETKAAETSSDGGVNTGERHDFVSMTHEAYDGFSKSLQKNMGVLGTIAAAVVVCTLVARGLRHENAPRELVSNETSTELGAELNDVNPASDMGPETVTAVTPDFTPTKLPPQTFPQQVNRQADPRGLQSFPSLEQPNLQRNDLLQNQTSTSPLPGQQGNPTTRVAQSFVQPTQSQNTMGRSASEEGFDPFTLSAFGGSTSGSQNRAAGSFNPSQPTQQQVVARTQQLQQAPPLQQPVPQLQQPAPQFRDNVQQSPSQIPSAIQTPNQFSGQQLQAEPSSNLLGNAKSNPYPSTGQATFGEIAADLQNSRSPQPAAGSATRQSENRFTNLPPESEPSQFGRTADRGSIQGYDARFGTTQTGTNTGVIR